MTSRHIIYGLTDPSTGAVRYVGKSTSGLKRPRGHSCPSRLRDGTHRSNWILSLKRSGLRYGIRILENCAAAEQLADAERRWIAHGRAAGWPLTNICDGGEGCPGSVRSPEQRAHLSAVLRGRPCPVTPEGRAVLRRPKSAETRAKMSAAQQGNRKGEAHKGRSISQEQRARIASTLTGRKRSMESRTKQAAALKGQKRPPFSAEWRANIAAAARRRATKGAINAAG